MIPCTFLCQQSTRRWVLIFVLPVMVAVMCWTACSAGKHRFGEDDSSSPGKKRIAPGSCDATTVCPDEAFNRLFSPSGPGWTGGDGTYSVPLPDGRTVWLFGDTFLGSLAPDRSRPKDSPFIRNSFVVQNDHHLMTLHGRRDSTPAAFLSPVRQSQWYWPADGTVAGNRLWVFFRRMTATGSGMWQWRYVGTDLVSFSLPDIKLRTNRPLSVAGRIRFGAAIMETDRHIYIFGTEDVKTDRFMHLARAPAGRPDAAWEYAADNRWAAGPIHSEHLLAGVANQFGVLRVGRQVCLVTMDARMPFSNRIVAYTAPAPAGPWSGPIAVFTAPEAQGDVVAYNACVHPQFTDSDGRVLISYNLNHVSDPAAAYADADVYRPRFIRVDLKQLLLP